MIFFHLFLLFSNDIQKPQVPLHTENRWIMDAENKRFKLAGVNWYGFEELDYVPAGLEIAHVDKISEKVSFFGFNSVRLPFSIEMILEENTVSDNVVAANPEMKGLTPIEVMDIVIDSLWRQGLVVILDNHSSEAVWYSLENGFWYTDEYPEKVWIETWERIAKRYKDHPAVVGFDLRNELRNGATWGGPKETDWRGAAIRAGEALLKIDPSKLIIVEGINYASDLRGVFEQPIVYSVPNRIVYSIHDYSWFHPDFQSYQEMKEGFDYLWGFVLDEDKPWTAPIWIGEFGTCSNDPNCVKDSSVSGSWFLNFTRYLYEKDIDWAYWPLNGTMANGETRTYGALDWYGILDQGWDKPSLPALLEKLQELQ